MKNQKGVSMVTLVITIVVILLLAGVTFVGSIKTIEKTNYSKYVSNVSDVSGAFGEKAAVVKGQKIMEDKKKEMGQIHNYIAKNGDEEKDFLKVDDVPNYTIIQNGGQLGIELPDMQVESGTGVKVNVKYAATSEGKIFTWPPIEHEDKLYITTKDTVEHKMQTLIKVGNEEFKIKIDSGDGSLLDWLIESSDDDDDENPGIPSGEAIGSGDHRHVFTSKTQTDEYFCSDATCVEPKKYYYKCISCDAKGTTTYTVGSALGHNFAGETLIKEANCTEKGVVQSKCTRCGTFANFDRPINSANHHGGEREEIIKKATCVETGSKTIMCASCNAVLRTIRIDTTDHNMDKVLITKQATCTEKGMKTFKCSGCGKEMKTEEIDALGHGDERVEITKTATCTEKGLKTYRCSICNVQMRTEEIEATGHSYGSFQVTKEATCKDKGEKTKTCSKCRDKITEEIPMDTSRHYGIEETKITEEATCLEDGKEEIVCSLCNAVLQTRTLAALGHDWSAPTQPRKCNGCGLEENLTPQAIYTSNDKTLTFINEFEIYEVGDTFNGKTVAGAYKGIEEENYSRGWDSISGDIERVIFSDEIKPKTISKWFYGLVNCTSMDIANLNTEDVTDMSYTFRNCSKLTALNVSEFDTSKVINMYAMFKDCNLVTGLDVSSFNTTNVTNIDSMFENCSEVKVLDVSNWITTNVVSMYNTFSGCTSLVTLNVSKFYTGNVTNMTATFRSCENVKELDLSNWNTEKVTEMNHMFFGCRSLTILDLKNFDTTKVINMSYMFTDCRSLTTLDISNFNTSNVTLMQGMFHSCHALLNLDVSGFNTSSATDMEGMFSGCKVLSTLNISNWDTSSVTDMSSIFSECAELTSLDISNFDTSKVTTMELMFYGCEKLSTIDVSNFSTDLVTNMSSMFQNCYNVKELDLSNFNTSQINEKSHMFFRCISLQKVTLGDEFSFSGDSSYLPEPNSEFIPGATGLWYRTSDGNSFAPSDIPNNTAATYVAINNNYTYNVVYQSLSGLDLGGTTVTKWFGTTNTISAEEIVGYSTPESQEITWDADVKTITFIYTPISYSVTIDCNGGTGVSSTSYTIETETFTLETPTREGYTFTGWTGSNGTTPEMTITITQGTIGAKNYIANWSSNEYTYNIIYQSTTGLVLRQETLTNLFGTTETITPPAYMGYNTPESQDVVWDSATEKVVIFEYAPIAYLITIDCNGGSGVSDMGYIVESATFTLEIPTREGYTFTGWTGSNGTTPQILVSIPQGSVGAKSYTANWSIDGYTYNVVYKSKSGIDLGSTTVTNKPGTTNTVEAIEITGYNTPASQSIVWDSEEPKTITFIYEPIEYKVTLDLNGGILDSIVDVATVGDYVNYSANGVTSWRVFDINDGIVYIIPADGPVGSVTLGYFDGYANAIPRIEAACDAYINDELQIGTDDVRSMKEEDIYRVIGYTQTATTKRAAWYLPDYYPGSGTVTYNGVNYTRYRLADGSHRFYEWDYSAYTTTDETGNTYAYPSGSNPVYQTIVTVPSLDISSYNHVVNPSIKVASLFSSTCGWLASKTTSEGDGWAANFYLKDVNSTDGIVRRYTVDSAGDGGTRTRGVIPMVSLDSNINASRKSSSDPWDLGDIVEIPYTIETETFTLRTPTKEGDIFDGWTGSNGNVAEKTIRISKGTTGNKNYIANWKGNSYTYSIVYQSLSGINLGNSTVTKNIGTTNTIVAPEITGYNTPASQNITWDTETKTITFIYNPTSYSVTINCNGGSGVSSMSYNIETPTFTIGTPTREGYTFAGWTGSNGTTPETSVSIAKGSIGALSYTANWEGTQAIYSATDNSLTFIKGKSINQGENFVDANGITKVATAVYTGFETATYSNSNEVPWNTNRTNIKSVAVENTIAPTCTNYWFDNFTNCSSFDVTNINISNTTSMKYMFANAGCEVSELKITGMNSWNTNKVTDMSYMFYYAGNSASTFDIGDLSDWDTSSVTDMACMFEETGSTTTNFSIGILSNWNTSNVTDMSFMFNSTGYNSSTLNLGNLGGWNTSKVTNMMNMFSGAGYESSTFYIGDLSGWDTSNVTDMSGIFSLAGSNASTFNIGNLGGWKTTNVTDMSNMFFRAGDESSTFYIGDLSSWDTSKVTDMTMMFYSAGYNAGGDFTFGNLNNWNTSNVTSMNQMFGYAGFKADTFKIGNIGGWDTSKVTDMQGMFGYTGYECFYFTIGDLSGWDTSNVTNMNGMFSHAGYSSSYTQNLSTWDVSKVTTHEYFDDGNTSKITPPNWVN